MNTLKKGTYFFGETFAPFLQTGGSSFLFHRQIHFNGQLPLRRHASAWRALRALVPRYADKRVVAVVAASAQRALAFVRAVVYAM